MKNDKNITDRINKSFGNVNKIVTTLNERPFGSYTFQAAKVMRNGILVGSMLNNSEAWMHLTQKNIEDLEKPDKVLKEKLFESNASKVFFII